MDTQGCADVNEGDSASLGKIVNNIISMNAEKIIDHLTILSRECEMFARLK